MILLKIDELLHRTKMHVALATLPLLSEIGAPKC